MSDDSLAPPGGNGCFRGRGSGGPWIEGATDDAGGVGRLSLKGPGEVMCVFSILEYRYFEMW